MPNLVFDKLKAVNSLKAAGFDDRQAEAVVTTIADAKIDDLAATRHRDSAFDRSHGKSDLDRALKAIVEPMVTREDLHDELTLFQESMTIRLGGIMVAGFGVLAVLICVSVGGG